MRGLHKKQWIQENNH